MCIVIDSNLFSSVFNPSNAMHREFSAVKRWIENGHGFVVFGGSSVKSEYGKCRALRLVRLMREQGQAIFIRDSSVDAREKVVRAKTANTRCNDQHFIALLGTSRCSLICSGDKRAYPYFKDKELYPKKMPKVRIYSSRANTALLIKCDKNSLSNVEYA